MSDETKAIGQTAGEEAPASRRRFLNRAWLALGGIALVEYGWLAFEFLRPRATVEDALPIVSAGPLDAFEPGSVTAFPSGRFYLVRLEDGGFLALSRTCTHLGCTVPWVEEESRFLCPCHASAFDRRGVVEKPPAPRPLDAHPVRIENGIVKVDLGRTVRRTEFAPDQVTYA
ncbi:MAG: Rieske (2Fe-2S) protein [marine benthic group bacterium]|jgi:cytochrome b6-f complex iron-sulfur subunit|nr:Rieske (2Fe-2S) protein [Gemmatimonadota bacterium]MCL7980643.1 Rieske (2Fe-2S) protein [Gemmatimonadota bacterium]MCL7982381.1 Rieske (2Fe-2S) protein [Gemmatimonadota bacterium]